MRRATKGAGKRKQNKKERQETKIRIKKVSERGGKNRERGKRRRSSREGGQKKVRKENKRK